MNLKNIVLSLALAVISFAQPLPIIEVHIAPGVGAILDQNDLGNGWYGGEKVKLDEKYLDVVNWMVTNGAPSIYSWHTAFTTDPNRPAPTSIVFTCSAGPVDDKFQLKIAFDAVYTYRSPGVTLVDVRYACGNPLNHGMTYPGYAIRTDTDPIGPQRAFRLYDVSDNFSETKWPVGSIYKRLVTKDGIEDQEHYERTFIIVSSGGFFQPTVTAPAWLRLR